MSAADNKKIKIIDIEDFTDLELQEELEYRGYAVYDEEIEEVDKEDVYDECWDDINKAYFTLQKDFSSNQLRDFLLDVVGRGHYISNDELLLLLKEKL